MKIFRHLVSLALAVCIAGTAFAAVREPSHLVEVLKYIPTRQELDRLHAGGVDFLFLVLADYPDRFQARDLAGFAGGVTLLVQRGVAPDSMQVMALNQLKGPVHVLLSDFPDTYAARRLRDLTGDVKITVFATHMPGQMDVRNLADVGRPVGVVVSADYPDTYSVGRLAELPANTRVALNVQHYPDTYTVRRLNELSRAITIFIAAVQPPASTWDAQTLAQLSHNFTVILGRSYTPAALLERLLIALENGR